MALKIKQENHPLQMLNELLDKNDKRRFFLLFLMALVAAILETAGISLIIPFIGVVTDIEIIFSNEILHSAYQFFGFESTNAFIMAMIFGLIMVFILKNLFLAWFFRKKFAVIHAGQIKLSKRLLDSYLRKPYIFHLQSNSAVLLRNVNSEARRVFTGIIKPFVLMMTESLVVLLILVVLLAVEPIATITAGVFLGGSLALFFKLFKNKIVKAGRTQQKAAGEMIKWINQSLGAIKEIKVSGREEFFVETYTSSSKIFANAARFYEFIKEVPRLFSELIVVTTVLVFLFVIVSQGESLASLITTVSLFAMAAFRIMPSINRIVGAQTAIKNNLPSLEVVVEDISMIDNNEFANKQHLGNQVHESITEKLLTESVEVKNISFKYPNSEEYVLKNVTLSIPIGSSIGLMGTSGSGKTTLVDIMLGLLEPSEGVVEVDGKNIESIKGLWGQKIGYIPQFIYLSDDSIRRNIALGIEDKDIDEKAVWTALQQAQLDEFVKGLDKKLDTVVGERGVRLSGGQRQRIGIARALYHNPEILFMDEATSALDGQTEKDVMDAIGLLKGEKTIIIIAHRVSTIEYCDTIYEMKDGKLFVGKAKY